MLKVKTRTRMIAFLSLALVIWAYTSMPILGSFEPLSETAADNGPSEIPNIFSLHRQIYSILDVYDNPQAMRLTSAAKAENAGRVSNTRNALTAGQILLGSRYELSKSYKLHPFFPVTASEKGHLSVLAFSLGGNSPPVYHA